LQHKCLRTKSSRDKIWSQHNIVLQYDGKLGLREASEGLYYRKLNHGIDAPNGGWSCRHLLAPINIYFINFRASIYTSGNINLYYKALKT